jgi:Lipid A 3-O-deacylase (PagL)
VTRLKQAVNFVALFVLITCCAEAQEYLIGVRGGTSFEKDAGNFQQVDVFAGMYLPWSWGSQAGFNLKPRAEFSAGWLDNQGDSGFVGALGPVVELRRGKFPVALEGGVSLSALSRSNFPERNLGGWFEFTDHVGLDWRVSKRFTLGWRFQHTSNAGIYQRNPGLNLQMVSAAYTF